MSEQQKCDPLAVRVKSECHLGDHAQRSPRAGEEPRQIEAGDVLHDLSTTADDIAAPVHELEAEQQVAAAPKPDASGPADAVAIVAPIVPRAGAVRVERQPLVVLARHPLDLGE